MSPNRSLVNAVKRKSFLAQTLKHWGISVTTAISHFQIYSSSRVPAEETYPFDIHSPFAYTVVGWQSLLIWFFMRGNYFSF